MAPTAVCCGSRAKLDQAGPATPGAGGTSGGEGMLTSSPQATAPMSETRLASESMRTFLPYISRAADLRHGIQVSARKCERRGEELRHRRIRADARAAVREHDDVDAVVGKRRVDGLEPSERTVVPEIAVPVERGNEPRRRPAAADSLGASGS